MGPDMNRCDKCDVYFLADECPVCGGEPSDRHCDDHGQTYGWGYNCPCCEGEEYMIDRAMEDDYA